MRYTFDELMRQAEMAAGGVDVPTRATIVKELLHLDILLALSRSELANRVTFQGGTALRLCYGGHRYSEDLDFTCGKDASEPFDIDDMAALLREHVAERYGLTVDVKQPGADRSFDNDGITVKRWALAINVPGFAAAQKIHFEVCNVPSYEPRPMLIQPRYDFVSDVYSDIALSVESLDEIYADKAVALIARSHVKARDLWDLRWLADRGTDLNLDRVRQKLDDYGVANVDERIDAQRERVMHPTAANAFIKEMSRFVTPSIGRQLVERPEVAIRMLHDAAKMLDRLQAELPAASMLP